MNIQPKNLAAVLIGSGQFSLAIGQTTVAGAQAAGFLDFGNVTVFSLMSKGQQKTHVGSYNGIRTIDKTAVIETQLGYQVKVDEIRAETLRFHLYGTPGAKTTQSAKSAAACDALTSPVLGVWYDLLITAVRYRKLTSVAIVSTPSVVENTDYVIDYDNGRIRFLTAPPGTLTSISITCPAITSGGVGSLTTITPNNIPLLRGIGRLICYDSDGNLAFRDEDFYCEVYPEGNPDFDGQKFTELTLNINKLNTLPGQISIVQSGAA